MNKKEVYEIGKLIKNYYEQKKFDQEKLDAWFAILQNYEFEKVKANLEMFVMHSEYAPKLSDLIQGERPLSSNVPGYEETKSLLGETTEYSTGTVAQEELAKMRKILGIEGVRKR